jgi:3-hexulose-6-phosphate synthase / 6-phospho-3-hexuloisomerase
MEYVKKTVLEITDHIRDVAEKLSEKEMDNAIDMIIDSKRVFLDGVGRSGMVAKAFAMRLSHLKFEVFVVGETINPAVRAGDLFIAISGSGKTTSVVNASTSAKKAGAKLLSITSDPSSTLAKMSDAVLRVRGRTKEDYNRKDYVTEQLSGRHEPLSPLGTLFEDTTMILLDGVIVSLMKTLRKTEEDLARTHSNVE